LEGFAVDSDAALVQSALAGEVGAFETLVNRYRRGVIATAAAVLRDRHIAEDVAQDAFVAAFKRLSRLRDPSRFGAWLMQISKRTAFRARRNQRGWLTVGNDAAVGQPPENRSFEGDEERLLQALAMLGYRDRVVVTLMYFEGMTVAEICSCLGWPAGTVTKQLTRARRRLAALIKENSNAR
jgi:RNA polymerase sigma-70 factor (ECF subfamily)